jgi:type II secretory pathway component PulJ
MESTERNHISRKGFSLLELLVFVGIFSLVIVGFMTIFVGVSQIAVRGNSSAEVASQSQFLLQTIQYYIERSSAIEITADTATSTLKLRMASSTEDPIIITLSGSAVTLQKNGGATTTLTSSKVSVTNLAFTRRTNPPGHDSVAIAMTVQYNTSNLKQSFSEVLNTGVTRVAAATFDSNVVPSTGNTYVLGASTGDWKSINGTIYFSGSKVGIGVASPSSTFQVSGGDAYIDTASQGLVLKAPNGTSCYRVTVTNGGGIATTSVGC